MSREREHHHAATFGGAGWKARTSLHTEDVALGAIWRRCGVTSEAAPLREVMLARPHPRMAFEGSPDTQLMLERPDLARLAQQAQLLAACYEGEGVRVEWASGGPSPSPNFIFQRDLFFVTPEGAIVGRPASEQRARESRWAAAALAAIGVPIIATMRGGMVFEGADALWLDPRTVIVGVGIRTNESAFAYLRGILGDMHVDARRVSLPAGRQHLLGVVNFFDTGRAFVRGDVATSELRATLHASGVEAVDWRVDEAWGMNFVPLAPRRVVLPAGCPRSRARLQQFGVNVREIEVGEYLKAAGGIGCATGVLLRDPVRERCDPPSAL